MRSLDALVGSRNNLVAIAKADGYIRCGSKEEEEYRNLHWKRQESFI